MDSKELGILIKKKREEKQMRQQELADFLHVSRAAVSKWETGTNVPDLVTLTEVSQILDLPFPELLQPDKPPDAEDADTPVEQTVQDPHIPDPHMQDPHIPVQQEAASPAAECSARRKKAGTKIAVAFGVETAALIAALIFIIVLYRDRPPVFTILDNFYDTYEGVETCWFIVEYEGRFTQDAWRDYVDTFRERYGSCFNEVQVIVVACFDRYDQEIDTVDSADYIVTIYAESFYTR